MSNLDVRALVRKLCKQGFSVELTKGGHLRVTNPAGQHINIANTPSDARSIRNLSARLKRDLGYDPHADHDGMKRKRRNKIGESA